MRDATPFPAILTKSQLKQLGWVSLFGGFVCLLVASVAYLLLSNALYLGWGDFVHYVGKARTWTNLWITVWTASLATLLAVMIGIPVGYTLSRYPVPFPRLLSTLIDLPVMVPPAAVGLFLLGVFKGFPVAGLCEWLGLEVDHAVPGVVVAQFTVTAAFCVRLVKASFDSVNPRFEAVSRSLGASLPRTFFRISLPLAKNGILASVIVVWARAAAEWESLMLFVGGIQGRTDTLPFAVYLDWNGGILGWSLTSSLFCVLIAVCSMYAVHRIGGRGYVW